SLTEVAALISLNGLVSLGASFIAGPATDRLGRKRLMVLSLAGNGLTYFLFSQASAYWMFAVLMAMRGFFPAFFRVATNAMISDLVEPERRPEAYAQMRMWQNLGIAIGPALGGFVVAASYEIGFTAAALGLTIYAAALALFAYETKPPEQASPPMDILAVRPRFGGYHTLLQDRRFVTFILFFTLFQMCSVLLWVLLGVYAKQNYGLPESQYGLIQATNALMVVLFQVSVTGVTKRYEALRVMFVGTTVYGLGVASIALGQGFWAFWLSYVVVTVGELIIAPTAVSFVADSAPVDQRGRYMGVYSLAQGAASTAAPVMGGQLNDRIGPKAIWIGGGLLGLTSAAGFWLMNKRAGDSK
ncbi:MAG: MDR family MFS transporter, partial [Candidatus Promineifilaceae bacterium]